MEYFLNDTFLRILLEDNFILHQKFQQVLVFFLYTLVFITILRLLKVKMDLFQEYVKIYQWLLLVILISMIIHLLTLAFQELNLMIVLFIFDFIKQLRMDFLSLIIFIKELIYLKEVFKEFMACLFQNHFNQLSTYYHRIQIL